MISEFSKHWLTRQAEIESFIGGGSAYSFDRLRDGFVENYGCDLGAVRVTVGIATNFADVHAFLAFLVVFVDKRAAELEAYLDDRVKPRSGRYRP